MINSFLINGKLLMDGYFVRLNILNACLYVSGYGQVAKLHTENSSIVKKCFKCHIRRPWQFGYLTS